MAKVKEIFVPIQGFEGFYEVSNYGKIKSLDRIDCMGQHRKELILKRGIDSDGYPIHALSKDKVRTTIKVHRVVAIHFIPNPDNLPQVNHKFGDKRDAFYLHLEWCTGSQNGQHARDTGLHSEVSETHKWAKLTNEEVLKIFNSKLSRKKLAKKYNATILTIGRIKNGYNWSHVTKKEYIKNRPPNLAKDIVLNIFSQEGTPNEIASKFNIPAYVVRYIKRGEVHSKITGKYHVKKSRQHNNPAPTSVGAGLNKEI